jgi:2,4-dienoyl-CoA reductase-like NADH-dependent reductase (Old Yellow Enzyme family)
VGLRPSFELDRNSKNLIAEFTTSGLSITKRWRAFGITDPTFAGQAIRDGRVDLVAVGRAFLTDPDWALSAKKTLNNEAQLRRGFATYWLNDEFAETSFANITSVYSDLRACRLH